MKKINDEDFSLAVKNNISMNATLKALDIRSYNYKTYYGKIKKLGLDISHWDPHAGKFKNGHNLNNKTVEETINSSNPYNIRGTRLSKKLVDEGYFTYNCALCQLSDWQGKPITLRLDHIDGNNLNYAIDNLRLICPNCDSQLDTYCRGQRKYDYCIDCSKKVFKGSKRCRSCASNKLKLTKETKINWPQINELILMIKNSNYTQISKKLGVSDNAIRKRLKHFNINPKTFQPL